MRTNGEGEVKRTLKQIGLAGIGAAVTPGLRPRPRWGGHSQGSPCQGGCYGDMSSGLTRTQSLGYEGKLLTGKCLVRVSPGFVQKSHPGVLGERGWRHALPPTMSLYPLFSPLTNLNVMPTGKVDIFKGLMSIFTEQAKRVNL